MLKLVPLYLLLAALPDNCVAVLARFANQQQQNLDWKSLVTIQCCSKMYMQRIVGNIGQEFIVQNSL